MVTPFALTTLVLSAMVTPLTKSWIALWLAMEINMTAMTILLMNEKSKESTIMFFIIQSIPSLSMLLSITLKWNPLQEANNPNLMMIVVVSMVCSMGMFPTHNWILKLSKAMTWNNNLIMMTWQSVIPLVIMMKIFLRTGALVAVTLSIVAMTAIMINTTNMKALFMASSMAHMSWMMMSMQKLMAICLIYLTVYSLLVGLITLKLKNWKVSLISQQNSTVSHDQAGVKINIMSLSGIPPMTGFFLKALVVYTLIKYLNPSKMTLVLLIMATGAFYAYNQTIIKMMTLKSHKKKEKKWGKATSEKSAIGWNSVLPLMVAV